MRGRLTFIALSLASLVALTTIAAQKPKTSAKPAKAPAIATAVLQIEGMSCYACVARIKKALKSVKGVTDVEVSLQKRLGEVQYQPAVVTPDSLARVITGLGYRAKPVAVRGAK